jgi:hypothetical protein
MMDGFFRKNTWVGVDVLSKIKADRFNVTWREENVTVIISSLTIEGKWWKHDVIGSKHVEVNTCLEIAEGLTIETLHS